MRTQPVVPGVITIDLKEMQLLHGVTIVNSSFVAPRRLATANNTYTRQAPGRYFRLESH